MSNLIHNIWFFMGQDKMMSHLRKTIPRLLIVLIAGIVIFPASTASAAVVTWYLEDVTFSNGARAFGSFDYDATTNTYSNIDISVFDSPSYGTVMYGVRNPSSLGNATTLIMVEEVLPDMIGVLELGLGFVSPLTNAGGTINIELYPTGFSVQGTCNTTTCTGINSPFDFPNGGRVTTVPPVPTLVALDPPDDLTGVSITPTLRITLNENIQAGTGNITIHRVGDNGVAATFDVTTDVIFTTDTAEFTVSIALAEATEYYVTIPSGAITEYNGNAFAGFTDNASWSFTTGDFTGPQGLTLTPLDDATNVTLDQNLVITFDENVAAGTGNITIFTAADDQQVEQIAIGAANVTIVNDTVTVDPTANLLDSTEYYVIVDAGAITDASVNNNPFAGITTIGDWSFTTGDYTEPEVVTLTPLDEATNVPTNQNLIIEFDENVAAGTGNITLFSGTPQELFNDPLDDASQLTVTTGTFGVDLVFGPPYTHFGVNDGAGGGDYGGDTPSSRVTYNGFDGGYLEAYGLASLTIPSVVEWQNIDITGATNLQFSADFASALQPDNTDSVTIEAIIDGGTPEQILFFTSATNNGTFQVDGSGTALNDTAQTLQVPISGTGTSLTIRVRLSVSASTVTGDDIAIDNVIVTGNVNTLVEQVTAGSSNVSIVDNVLTFDPTVDLNEETAYYVIVDAGAITDDAISPNDFAGILTDTEWNFETGDFTAPILLTLYPADAATNVAIDSNLVLTFDKSMQVGTGSIELRESVGNTLVESFDVASSGLITVSTTTLTDDTITINPTANLSDSTEYYIFVPATALTDNSANTNAFAGLTATTDWNLTTGDFTAPTVVTLDPADDATAVPLNTNLTLTFDEPIQTGSGNITIRLLSDDTIVETITVPSAQVGTAGNLIGINPTADLMPNVSYYVTVDAGAFTDVAVSPNDFAGILTNTEWNFTTVDQTAPLIVTLNPADDATAVSPNTVLSIVFNEGIQAGTGNITLFDSTNAVVELFDVTSDISVSTTTVANDTVTFTPTTALDGLTSYYVQIEATAVTDDATTPNAFAGIADTTSWNFTIAEPAEYVTYLPMIMTPSWPDLIVENVTVTSTDISIVIRNVGSAPVTDGFYVDAYLGLLDPTKPPTSVNDIWQSFSPQGVVWGIEAGTTPLAAGASLTLTLNDSYQIDTLSTFAIPLSLGTAVYVQVDSASAGNTNGGVLELHEAKGGPYNNILGPVFVP